MYYAIPGKIVKLEGLKEDDNLNESVHINEAIVDIFGVKSAVNIHYLDNPKIGDYILIHAGCAIKKINKEYYEYLYSTYQSWMEEC